MLSFFCRVMRCLFKGVYGKSVQSGSVEVEFEMENNSENEIKIVESVMELVDEDGNALDEEEGGSIFDGAGSI